MYDAPVPPSLPDPWWAKFWASQLPLMADWSQTLYTAQHPEAMYEHNPILGAHPSLGNVNTYFGLASLGNLGAGFMPTVPRRIVRGGLLALELANVIRNRAVGVGFSAPF